MTSREKEKSFMFCCSSNEKKNASVYIIKESNFAKISRGQHGDKNINGRMGGDGVGVK